jgi:hypothetical protein
MRVNASQGILDKNVVIVGAGGNIGSHLVPHIGRIPQVRGLSQTLRHRFQAQSVLPVFGSRCLEYPSTESFGEGPYSRASLGTRDGGGSQQERLARSSTRRQAVREASDLSELRSCALAVAARMFAARWPNKMRQMRAKDDRDRLRRFRAIEHERRFSKRVEPHAWQSWPSLGRCVQRW